MSEWIVSSSVLIALVIGIRYLFRNKLAMRARYALWLLVAVRLLVPVAFSESYLSVMNYLDFRMDAPGRDGRTWAEAPEDMSGTEGRHTEESEAVEVPIVPLGQAGAGPDRESGSGDETDGGVLTATGNQAEGDFGTGESERSASLSLGQDAGRSALFWIWLSGAALSAGTVLVMNRSYRRKVYISRKRYATEVESRLPVYVSEAVATPCMFGLLHPAVYLNHRAAGDRQALGYVLCHENCHYRHRDNLWVLVRAACVCLHWYNPLVWLAACLSRQDGELACDERSLEILGEEERIRYGRVLLDFSEQGGMLLGGLKLSTAMSGGKRQLKERLLLIVREPRRHSAALAAVMALSALCSALTFTGRVSGQEAGSEGTAGEGAVSLEDSAGSTAMDGGLWEAGSGADDSAGADTEGSPKDGKGGSRVERQEGRAQSTSIVPIDLNDGRDHTLKIAGEADMDNGEYHIRRIELNRIQDRTEETLQTIRPEDVRVLYTRPMEDIRNSGGGMWSYATDREPQYAKPLYTVEDLPAREAGNFLADGNGDMLSHVVGGAIFVADLNFDGYQDFCLQGGVGDANVPYYCYLWNPEEGRFDPAYMIPNVRVDEESGLIESSTEDGDGRSSTKYYRFDESDILHMVRYVEEDRSPGALFPTLDLTYCETFYALPAVDEWDYGTRYGGALTERFVYWAKEALRELYEWSGTRIDKACFCVGSYGDVSFGNTPEDIRTSRIFYSRRYGERAGFEECIQDMELSTERVVWYSPVTQWNVPEGSGQMTDLQLVEWYFGRSPLAEGEEIASIYENSEGDYTVEAESGNYYWIYMDGATREIGFFCGPYDSYPNH